MCDPVHPKRCTARGRLHDRPHGSKPAFPVAGKGSHRLLDRRRLGEEFIYYSYPISWAIGILIVLDAYLHGGWKKKAIVAPTNREEQPADHLSPFAN